MWGTVFSLPNISAILVSIAYFAGIDFNQENLKNLQKGLLLAGKSSLLAKSIQNARATEKIEWGTAKISNHLTQNIRILLPKYIRRFLSKPAIASLWLMTPGVFWM